MYFVPVNYNAPDPWMWEARCKADSISPNCVTVLPDIYRALLIVCPIY